MANITIKDSLRLIAQAAKDYTDYVAVTKVNVVSGKGLSTNDLTNALLANYNAAYEHSVATHAPVNAQRNADILKSEIEAKLTGTITSHDHNYAGSSSPGGSATSASKVNKSIIIKLNSGTTEGTNMYTFNGSAAKTINITPGAIGASDSGHNHDDKYFTESEINTKVTTLEGKITTAQSDAQAYAKTYTDTAVAGLLDTAPEALNTLNELAAALGDDPNFSTTIMTEIGKKANSSHGNHVPTTQTANNAVFLRNDNTWQTITPANIGAAKASHGTHVTWATNAPLANGTAAVGTAARVAREDHVHPLQTTVSGNAGSANKVNKSMVVKLNSGTTEGTDMFTFDGSAAKSINITPAAIGAAEASHGTHLTLGTGSGNAFRGDYGNTAYNHSQAAHAPSNAQPNQNAFSNFTVGSTTISADGPTDTLTIVAGSNITLTPDATNDKITITATDTIYTHPSSHAATMITEDSSHRFVTDEEKSVWNAKASTSAATTSSNGLMTSAMVTKLNGIAEGANKYSHPTSAGNKHIPSGGSSGQYLQWSASGTAQWATITPASIGVEQISDAEVEDIITTVFGE